MRKLERQELISYLERTGSVNKYTFKEIAEALNITTEEIENFTLLGLEPDAAVGRLTNTTENRQKKMIEHFKEEILFLREQISAQWLVINSLTLPKEKRGNNKTGK